MHITVTYMIVTEHNVKLKIHFKPGILKAVNFMNYCLHSYS